jgi:predicted nucleotidyltransferase
MRLSNYIVDIIKKSILKSFGDVGIYLFGSRVDDSKKGGDIDIAVDVDISKDEFIDKKVRFISSMMRYGVDLKIDLVSFNSKDELLNKEIKSNHIKLN